MYIHDLLVAMLASRSMLEQLLEDRGAVHVRADTARAIGRSAGEKEEPS